MITKITLNDRRKNPKATYQKNYQLISIKTGKVLGYGTIESLIKQERQIQYFKRKH